MQTNKNTFTRRGLLKKGAGLATGAIAAPYMLTSTALGAEGKPAASERLTIGHIGVGGMGSGHVGVFRGMPDVQIVAVADVYEKHRQAAMNTIGNNCKGYNDYRELLARRGIDAVVIAVPDHWHALIAIHACEAGKDVYCEKPLSLTIREARAMVNAARRNGTVFQVGSQQRSEENFRRACEYVQNGRIGKLLWASAGIGGGPTCGYDPNTPPPPGLDWNFWLGPAPYVDFNPQRCVYNFRWFYEYSGGKMTDWGAHHNDIAQWGIGASHTGPIKSEPVFAQFPTEGLYDTSTKFQVKHTYANGVYLITGSDEKHGAFFQGTDGWVHVDRGFLEVSDPDIEKEPLGAGEIHLYKSPGHHRDWLNCIKTRQRPITDVEIGCRSVTVCHLGNIAIRTGKTVHWDPVKEDITNDEGLRRWLSKPYRDPWKI